MNKIRIGDFPLGKEERAALQRVIDSGRITEHREVHAFEDEFAAWLGIRHCIALNSGTSALIAGLTAFKYDERYDLANANVLIPALTFIATANAVELCGMRLSFGDIDPITFCLRPDYIRQEHDIILPVHLFGYVADMHEIKEKARMAHAIVVEDACEAHGSYYNEQRVGTLGLWAAFSFYIAHTVQAGELGVVVTNDAKIAQLVRRIKAHGRECACKVCTRSTGQCPFMKDYDPRYRHVVPGFNFKPMEFQAALARVQLKKIDENIDRRFSNVVRLNRGLGHLQDKIIIPHLGKSMAHMAYPVIIRKQGIRNQILMELEKRGIECRPLFGCIPTQQPAYAGFAKAHANSFPVAEYYGANGFFVGCHQYLSYKDVEYMIEVLSDVLGRIV